MKESKNKWATEWMESRFAVKAPWLGGPVSESENRGKMPGGYFKEPRTVTHVLCGLGCKQPGPCPVFPSFHQAPPPMLTPAPCLLRMWLCNLLSFSSDVKGKRSFSFEPFLLDPYQERTLSASLGALSSLYFHWWQGSVFFNPKVNQITQNPKC